MPVTKVTPSAWSGHTAIAIRELASRRLIALTQLSSTAYLWTSTDCGNTWSALTELASFTKALITSGDTTFLAPGLSRVFADNSILIRVGYSRTSSSYGTFFGERYYFLSENTSSQVLTLSALASRTNPASAGTTSYWAEIMRKEAGSGAAPIITGYFGANTGGSQGSDLPRHRSAHARCPVLRLDAHRRRQDCRDGHDLVFR